MQIYKLKVGEEFEMLFATKEKALFFAVNSEYDYLLKDMKNSNAYEECNSLEMTVKGYDRDGKHYTVVSYYPAFEEQRQSHMPYAKAYITPIYVEE